MIRDTSAATSCGGRWPGQLRSLVATLAGVGVAVALLLAGVAGVAAAQPPTPAPPPAATTAPASPAAPGPAAPRPPDGPPVPPALPPVPATPAAPGGNPSFWDVPGQITKSINNWLTGLVTSAAAPVGEVAGTLLAPPQFSAFDRLRDMWSGSAALANTLYVLLVLAAGAVLMGHETVQTRYAVKEIAPRLVIGMVAANLSWELVKLAAQLAGTLAVAVAGDGLSPGAVLGGLLRNAITGGPIFLIIVGLVATVMMFVLLLCMIVVAALLIVLIAGAPLALSFHALPQTEWIAQLWWKATFGCLAIPTLQALIMAAVVRVVTAPGGFGLLGVPTPSGIVNMLVLIALIYLMIKVPFWVLRGALGKGGGRSRVMGIVKSVLIYKGLQATGIPLFNRRGAGKGAAGKGTAGKPGGGRAGGGKPRGPWPRPSSPGGGAANRPNDPYRKTKVGSDGQYRLPLQGVRRTRLNRPSPTPTPTAGTAAEPRAGTRRAYRGRQLALPLQMGRPDEQPVLTQGGQYRLPITATRQPRRRPVTPPAPPPTGRLGSPQLPPTPRRPKPAQLTLMNRAGQIPKTLRGQ